MFENPAYMTDEEAATVVCPMGVGAGMNNKILIIKGLDAGRPCLGSNCAAWRHYSNWNEETEEMEYDLGLGYCGIVGLGD